MLSAESASPIVLGLLCHHVRAPIPPVVSELILVCHSLSNFSGTALHAIVLVDRVWALVLIACTLSIRFKTVITASRFEAKSSVRVLKLESREF